MVCKLAWQSKLGPLSRGLNRVPGAGISAQLGIFARAQLLIAQLRMVALFSPRQFNWGCLLQPLESQPEIAGFLSGNQGRRVILLAQLLPFAIDR